MERLNLKCEDVKLWGDKQTLRRWKRTLTFVENHYNKVARSLVLDMGGKNEFGEKLVVKLRSNRTAQLDYVSTKGDLNHPDWYPSSGYDTIGTVFFFDVLEHLTNQLLPFYILGNYIHKDTQIFVSFPRGPRWLKSDRHYHEPSAREFFTIIDEADYEIIAYENYRGWHDWWFYLTGFRPFIRFWCVLFGLSKNHLYLLKSK
jgi:hypothetical protein